MLVVNDIMTRHIDQVDSGHELGDVARLMARARISSVIVLDNEELAGIVTERDVLHAMRKGRASDTPVAAIMSTPVIAVPPELDCREAYQLAAAKGVRHLAVTDKDNVPVGIVTETDFRYHLQLMLVAGKNDVASAMDNPLWTLPPDAGLDEALELMENRRATCVVITEERRPLGIVTERDVVRLYSKDKQHARLADVMTTPVVTIPAGAPLHDAADLMLARRIRHIVVIDDKGMMVGLLTEHGLMRPLELGIAEEVFKERRRAEVELLDKDAQIATLIEALPDAIYFKDGDGRWQVVNSAGVALFGLADQSWQGKNEDELALLNPAYAAAHRACKTSDERAWQIGGISHDAEVVEDAQGEAHHFDVTKVPLFWPDGRRKGLVIIGRDMTERKRADDKQRLAASVFEQAQEAILITDTNSIIIEVNRSFTELTGYDREEAVGRKPSLLRSDRQGKDFYDRLWQTLAQEGQWRGEIWNRKKNGDEYAEVLTISCVRDGDGRIQHYVGISSDITQQKEHQKRLEQLAHYDALTQLPNRVLLADRMQLALAQAQRSGRLLAVGYLDLDDFKPINDTLGHDAGDQLLIEVAQRLKGCMRAGDTVSRFGGDEFALLLSSIESSEECERALERILATLAAPFTLKGEVVNISASIGVTIYPHDNANPDTLLRHADQSMYLAKQAGRNRYHLYDAEHDRRARAHREVFERIEAAHLQQEFCLYFQPKVDIRRGIVIGAEALIRWQHPERGLVAPADFLPVIEDSDFSLTLGDWVICEALRQMEAWLRQGIDLHVSVNISARQLQEANFSQRLAEQLAAHPAVKPQQLELEILETAALEDINRVHAIIEECRQLGVSFALDDFGTGYSSLTYLKRLPARILKIDQSFVRDMLDDPEDLAIVEGVIGLTNAFHREVIAEGVETSQHGILLLQLGCNLAQGYGIARPMPGADIPAWVGRYKPDPVWTSTLHLAREDFPLLAMEIDHNKWIERIAALLEASPAPDGINALPDQRECRFGRWYEGAGQKRYGALQSFRDLAPLHENVHRTAHDLLNLYQAGHLDAARQRLLKLYIQRDLLLDQLRNLQVDASLAGAVVQH